MSEPAVLPEAQPLSHRSGRLGALVIHGFTGNPASMRPIAEAFVAAGWSVEMPRLPGHGTTVADMLTTSWSDWVGEVRRAHTGLAADCDVLVAIGQSMGGSLALQMALEHGDLAAVIAINPKVVSGGQELRDLVVGMIADGTDLAPSIGSDIAKEGVVESSYDATPLPPLVSFLYALDLLEPRLGECTMPLMVLTSPNDHVVPPSDSDHLASRWSGPVERVRLERSYHVATLDHDGELICEAAVGFATKVVTAG